MSNQNRILKAFSPQFYLPPEAAYNCVAQLGELGLFCNGDDGDGDHNSDGDGDKKHKLPWKKTKNN